MSATAAPPRRRRRHRIIVPAAVALVLLLVTGVTYAIEEPDPADPEFLSPASTSAIGGSRLARALLGQGVTVTHHTRTSDALIDAYQGDATLFVPAPEAIQPAYLRMLALLPVSTRVVLVAPAESSLRATGSSVQAGSRRWTTRAAHPDEGQARPCPIPEARQAGTAAALRQRYSGGLGGCYGDGLLRAADLTAELVVIGASDPFRNDRIREHGNEELATGLLGTRSRVLWLDRHQLEPPPGYTTERPTGPGAPPSLYPGDEGNPYGTGGEGEGDGRPGSGSGDGESDGDGNGNGGRDGDSDGEENEGSANGQPDGNPLWDAFPAWFWAMLALLAIAALLAAGWRARRLGPPVTEPLPVRVRAHETVLGRGRLYQRARATRHSGEILRTAARQTLARRLRLAPETGRDDLVAAVVAQTGRDAQAVDDLLHGPAVGDEAELVALARALHDLTAQPAGQTAADRREGDDW